MHLSFTGWKCNSFLICSEKWKNSLRTLQTKPKYNEVSFSFIYIAIIHNSSLMMIMFTCVFFVKYLSLFDDLPHFTVTNMQ